MKPIVISKYESVQNQRIKAVKQLAEYTAWVGDHFGSVSVKDFNTFAWSSYSVIGFLIEEIEERWISVAKEEKSDDLLQRFSKYRDWWGKLHSEQYRLIVGLDEKTRFNGSHPARSTLPANAIDQARLILKNACVVVKQGDNYWKEGVPAFGKLVMEMRREREKAMRQFIARQIHEIEDQKRQVTHAVNQFIDRFDPFLKPLPNENLTDWVNMVEAYFRFILPAEKLIRDLVENHDHLSSFSTEEKNGMRNQQAFIDHLLYLSKLKEGDWYSMESQIKTWEKNLRVIKRAVDQGLNGEQFSRQVGVDGTQMAKSGAIMKRRVREFLKVFNALQDWTIEGLNSRERLYLRKPGSIPVRLK